MKRKELTAILKAHFSVLRKLATRVGEKTKEKDVHDFRVEIKKLRALLRLLNYASGIKLSKRFKTIYRQLGVLRNLQVMEQQVTDIAGNNKDLLPLEFFTSLKEQLREQKKDIAALPVEKLVKREERRLLKLLPAKLNKETITKFILKKRGGLVYIIALQDIVDERLHDSRKILKDILYNWDYLKSVGITPLPGFLSQKRNVKGLTERLGIYQDVTTVIRHMNAIDTGKHGEPGKTGALDAILHKLETHRSKTKKPIIDQLKRGLFTPSATWKKQLE